MSDKKKSSSSKDKKSSSSKKESKSSSSKENLKDVPPSDQGVLPSNASVDFEAGLLFSKYDKSNAGVITAEDFRKIIGEYNAYRSVAPMAVPAESKMTAPQAEPTAPVPPAASSTPQASASNKDPANFSFEAGKIFAQYDRGDGRVDKQAFENMLLSHPGLLGSVVPTVTSPPAVPASYDGPTRALTHYDETAGVAIPQSSVASHQAMGNSVVPLVESYSTRYTRLRTMLTAKLLPKREHLLQLKRQLQVTAVEVDAVRKAVENETLSDTQQILDRLKQVEHLRQSAIKHQMLQLEKELQAIDRLVQRIEAANNINPFSGSTNFSGLNIVGSSPSSMPISTASGQAISSMVEIIQQYSELSGAVDRLASKEVSVQVDFRTDDFPKETSERLEIISKCDKYLHAIAVKDQMLWVAMQDKKKAEDSLEQERRLSQEYAQEIAQWADMAQQLAGQIKHQKQENQELERRVEELTSILREHRIFDDIVRTP